MEPSLYILIGVVGFIVWLIGHSFIGAFFSKKEEMINRMIDNKESE